MRQCAGLSCLIIMAIGLGIGASMTMLAVLRVMGGDPIPLHSGHLFYPHMEPAPADYLQFDPGNSVTWPDAMNLVRAGRAHNQAAMAPGRDSITNPALPHTIFQDGHYVTSQFFAMFDAPFLSGSHWDAKDDAQNTRVVVLNGELARRLFDDARDAVGKSVRIQDHDFTVVGVLNNWHPEPLFYGGLSGDWAFKSDDQFFLPLSTALALSLPITGGEICWGQGSRTSDKCSWLQVWVQLDSEGQISAYHQFLANYWTDQISRGRPLLSIPPRLQSLMERLDQLHLVPSDVRLQAWLAAGFFFVCLFNTVSLMLAKFLRRSDEIRVRRALGASRSDIFLQFGVEAMLLGSLGGVLGLLITSFGLWLIHQRPDAYAKLAHVDALLITGTVVAAIIASLAAGLLPAWRASRVPPAVQI
jgi:putative ABC transport system permease protein